MSGFGKSIVSPVGKTGGASQSVRALSLCTLAQAQAATFRILVIDDFTTPIARQTLAGANANDPFDSNGQAGVQFPVSGLASSAVSVIASSLSASGRTMRSGASVLTPHAAFSGSLPPIST